jgi:DNA-binding NtrC family response regulator
LATSPVVLLVEGDILVRHPLAKYLRECGFTVFEVANAEEAKAALSAADFEVELVLADKETQSGGTALREWLRKHRPDTELLLAASIEATLQHASNVCEDGPAIRKAYEHHSVLKRIQRALAKRHRRRH